MERPLNKSSDEDWFFLTDRSNLITIFSSGVVQFSNSEFQHRSDVRDDFSGRVVFFQGGVPADAVDCLKEEGSRTPAILRFESKLSDDLTEITKPIKGVVLGVSHYPVSLRNLRSLEFLTKEDQKDSSERLGMLGSLGGEYVSKKQFSALNSSVSTAEFVAEIKAMDVNSVSSLDDAVGGIAAVLQINIATEYQSQVAGAIARDLESIHLGERPGGSWLITDVESEASALKSDFDKWLWPALVKKLLALSSIDNFGNLAFLDEFINEKTDLPDRLRPIAEQWRDFVKEVLDNDRDVPKLDDKGWPVQRGALLFLLRRTPDSLMVEEADDGIDWTVKAVAVAFSGCFVGFMGVDDNLRPQWPVCISIVDSLIGNQRGIRSGSFVRFKVELNKKSESIFSLSIGDELLSKYDSVHDDLNKYVFEIAERSGYELEIDCTGGNKSFISTSSSSRKKGKRIYLTRVLQKNSPFRPIRIESICKELSGKNPLGRINKDVLVQLLTSGGATDGRARYSISESKNSIVAIKDQLSDTLGQEEFFRHLEVVESTVDNYVLLTKKK